jgi:hypothetical protein
MEQENENERFVVKNGIKRVYICKYDWSSGSLIFKQKQSRFHDDRSINLGKKPRNIWLHSRFLLEMSVNICNIKQNRPHFISK